MNKKNKIAFENYQAKLTQFKTGSGISIDETKEEQTARINRAKRDFAYFVEYYLSHYITDPDTNKIVKSADFHIYIANKVKREKRIKAILRWGRAQAKSVIADVFIPLWLWINDDIKYMVIIGNNYDKAEILQADLQSEFAGNPKISHDFGEQRIIGSWEKGYFSTKSGFVCKAIGMGQDVRGLRMKNLRPDYIVADDLEDKDTLRNPKKQDEIANWILSSVLPTMDGSRARFILANNLFAPRMIQTVLEELRPNWTIHTINAYNPSTYEPRWKEKYTADYWITVEEEIGRIAALSEYCNKPHKEGKIFKKEHIIWLKEFPKLNQFKAIVAHWDVAYSGKNDYNAVRIWGLYNNKFYYIKSFVRQTKMKEPVQWMCDVEKELPKTVSIHWQFESQFWNDAVLDTIKLVEEKNDIQLNLSKIDTPKTKKYERIVKMEPYYQNRRIFYSAKMKGDPDTQEGNEQLFSIEPGYRTHDDAPDADEQCIRYLEQFIRRSNTNIRTGSYKKQNSRKWYS